MTCTTPFSLTQYTKLPAATGNALNGRLSRRCRSRSPVAASPRVNTPPSFKERIFATTMVGLGVLGAKLVGSPEQAGRFPAFTQIKRGESLRRDEELVAIRGPRRHGGSAGTATATAADKKSEAHREQVYS